MSNRAMFALLGTFLLAGCGSDALVADVTGPPGVSPNGSAQLVGWAAGGEPPYACTWEGGGEILGSDCDGVEVSPSEATDYAFTVTDAGGKQATAAHRLEIFGELAVSVEPLYEIVTGDAVTIEASVTGGVPDVRCSWRVDGRRVSDTCGDLTVDPTTDSIYTLIATDPTGNVQLGTSAVRVYDQLVASVDPGLSQYLVGDEVELTPTLAGGVPPRSCRWTLGDAELSTECGRVRFDADDDAIVTLEVHDASIHAATTEADVRVLKITTEPPPQVISEDLLGLFGTASGLIGDAECHWAQGGQKLNTGTDCDLEVSPIADMLFTLTLTDSETANQVEAAFPIDVAAPRCDDGVLNGHETDVDCGGTAPKAWINEVYAIDGFVQFLVFEVAHPPDAGGEFTPKVYAYDSQENAYTPQDDEETQVCAPSSLVDDVAFQMCIVSVFPDNAAIAVAQDGRLMDFILLTGEAIVPAQGGLADGAIPRPIHVPLPIFFADPNNPGAAPERSACLVGTGTVDDFTWQTDCEITMENFLNPGGAAGPNPGQTITGFRVDCDRCLEGQFCEESDDCEGALACDEVDQLCVPGGR